MTVTARAASKWITPVVAFLIGVVFGPLITGSLDTLFWSEAADGNDAQRVAGQLYDATMVDPLAGANTSHVPSGKCGSKLHQRLSSGHASEADLHAFGVFSNQRRNLMRVNFDSRGVGTLITLPKGVLGALYGCVSGSPAGEVCRTYVVRRVESAIAVPEPIQRKWILDANRMADATLCAVNPQ